MSAAGQQLFYTKGSGWSFRIPTTTCAQPHCCHLLASESQVMGCVVSSPGLCWIPIGTLLWDDFCPRCYNQSPAVTTIFVSRTVTSPCSHNTFTGQGHILWKSNLGLWCAHMGLLRTCYHEPVRLQFQNTAAAQAVAHVCSSHIE